MFKLQTPRISMHMNLLFFSKLLVTSNILIGWLAALTLEILIPSSTFLVDLNVLRYGPGIPALLYIFLFVYAMTLTKLEVIKDSVHTN